MTVLDGTFGDLRKLADWFSTSPQRSSLHIGRIVKRLGAVAVPMLGRELACGDLRRREAARDCLLQIAGRDEATRDRVLVVLRGILEREVRIVDEAKVCVLGLLAELGAHAEAHFHDPGAMQRRSALALAAQLETPADVANAADMMIGKLDGTAILQMLEALAEAAPPAAQRLAHELVARLDLDPEVREHIADQAYARVRDECEPIGGVKRIVRPTHVAVLVAAGGSHGEHISGQARVVVASRKLSGERRWRRWAVLIGTAGYIEDCLHEDAVPPTASGADGDAAALVANLVADGYHVTSTDLDHARTVVTAAARLSASRPDPQSLTSAYYLGRDLLDLTDAHLGPRRAGTLALARAVEHLADGDVARARALLDQDPAQVDASADHAAAIAACALAQGHHADAIAPLGKAIALEPTWPLHHWNLAVATHALGDHAGTYHALRRFLATSARPTALLGDPDQPGRVAFAEARIVELERAARLAGRSLSRRKRARRTTAKPRRAEASERV